MTLWRWRMIKRKKSLLAIFLVVAFLAVSVALALDYKYVGSKNSNIYHYPTCRAAQKIKPENLVTFNSAKEAQEKGYRPCKVCRPPATD
jgi:flagellar basal body-associated protein FliL